MVLLRHAKAIKRGSEADSIDEMDRKDVEERFLAAVMALTPVPASGIRDDASPER
jgi:hypothetical protein